MFMIENWKYALDSLKLRLQIGKTSFYHYILKHLNFYEWGEEHLLPIICKMWHLKICVVDPLYHDKIRDYGITFGNRPSHSLFIIYNTINHFSGTGELIIILLQHDV